MSVRPSVCVFVPQQIIMRTLFRLIICTFCYDISFKCWIFQNPMVFPPWFIGFYGVPTYVEPNSEEFNSNLEYYVWILPIILHTGEFFLSSPVIAEEFYSNLEYYVWDLQFFSNWIILKTKHLIPNENYLYFLLWYLIQMFNISEPHGIPTMIWRI